MTFDQLKKNQEAIKTFRAIGCGSCKGTGVRHEWDANGNLVATGEVCEHCHGTALANQNR